MADNRAPFKSSVSDYTALRKRAEELGILKPLVEEKPAPVEPNAPITPQHDDYYGCGLPSTELLAAMREWNRITCRPPVNE